MGLVSLVDRLPQVMQTEEGNVHFAEPDSLGLALLLASTLVIVWRRRSPLVVLLVIAAALFAYHELGYAPPPLPYGLLIAMFTVAEACEAGLSVAVAGSLVAGVLLLDLTSPSPITDDQFLGYVVTVGAAWLLGHTVQLHRVRATLEEERAVQLARQQDTATRLAVEQERARIARDLHDVVAHHVSMIVVQATVTQKVPPERPDQVMRTLHSIEASGREALVEMRRMLDVLGPEGEVEETDERPGLGRLPALCLRTREAGLPTELTVIGEPLAVPPAVDVTAYRIVQEALTNAVKHAGPARAQVTVEFRESVLRLSVLDDGVGGDPPRSHRGRGIEGMHQRVALVGGRLRVGPRSKRGFAVAAELPVAASVT